MRSSALRLSATASRSGRSASLRAAALDCSWSTVDAPCRVRGEARWASKLEIASSAPTLPAPLSLAVVQRPKPVRDKQPAHGVPVGALVCRGALKGACLMQPVCPLPPPTDSTMGWKGWTMMQASARASAPACHSTISVTEAPGCMLLQVCEATNQQKSGGSVSAFRQVLDKHRVLWGHMWGAV